MIQLPDDCEVYSVQLVVVPRGAGAGDGQQQQLLQSLPRRFWPAAHRATLEPFSDSLLLSWPPACALKTAGWRMETCVESDDDCAMQTLNSESPLHIAKLRPCTAFRLRLLSPPTAGSSEEPAPAGKRGVVGGGETLWTFSKVRTLPRPKFDLKAGHESVRLRIGQEDCKPSDRVLHWRITHCRHQPSDQSRKLFGGDPDVEHEASEYTLDLEKGDSEGSGDGTLSDLDEEYYYYYDSERGGEDRTAASDTTPSCLNLEHNISSPEEPSSDLFLEGLRSWDV